MEIYRVAFIGHRELFNIVAIENEIEEIAKGLMRKHEFVEFYIGRNGDFDILAASAIKRARKNCETNNSELILVLPYSVKDECYYEEYYDNIYYPLDPKTHYKNAIQKRNEWLVENCDMLIAYVEPNRLGGAMSTLQYAKKSGVNIINLYDKKETSMKGFQKKEKVIILGEEWDKDNLEWFKKAIIEGISRRIQREIDEYDSRVSAK